MSKTILHQKAHFLQHLTQQYHLHTNSRRAAKEPRSDTTPEASKVSHVSC